MSKRQWLVLLMLFLTYLLLGASMFYLIESPLEIEQVRQARVSRIEIIELLHKYYNSDSDQNHSDILEKLGAYCNKPVKNYTENEVDVYKWDFYNSFYFAYTVVSTIGYGNLAPTNMLGRILMIFYGLIGIPMNGILLAQLGEFFGNVFVRAHKKYKAYKEGHSDSPNGLNPLETRRAGLAVQIFIYLTPGFIMFIFFPAFLFSSYEGWDYDESVYYAFVTLTTIGFGDYVAGQDNTKGSGVWWIAYKIFLIFWISFGLGYLVMIMSFIARGMRSKRITRLEHKLVTNLKYTQGKILQEFTKDVNYVRRVFNEIYLMKLKPLYQDEYDSEVPLNNFPRSHSFPDLRELIYGGLNVEGPVHPRRRANSAVVEMNHCEAINRVVSETDLARIDKKATFAANAMVQPAELLAQLVTAMSFMPPGFDNLDRPEEEEEEFVQSKSKGVDGFSDKDILASEKPWAGSGWKIGGDKMPPPRTRAASEIGLTKDQNGFGVQQNSEWTWSGPAASKKLQELMKARKNSASDQSKEGKSRLPSFSFASVPKNIRPRWFNPFSSKKNSGEMSRSDSLPADDIETTLRENYLSHTTNTRPLRDLDRRRSAAPHYFTHTGGNLPNAPDGNLLEETSLADFFRALTSLHSTVGAVPEDLLNKPQRKMGTASLTPPKLPSLLALFAPPLGLNSASQSNQSTVTAGQNAGRRFSLRPSVENSGNSTPSYNRRDSLISGSAPRRFSMKPEGSSGTATPTYERRGSLISNSRPRKFSVRNVFMPERTSPHNSPPYITDMVPLHIHERRNPPPYSADPFIFECSKEPLVSAEVGPAQDGISLPVRATPAPRRFSLRPAQIGVPPAPPLPKVPPTGRPVPRWKGGMLQRQIGELSLQRRARAFSLGDVNSIRSDRTIGPTSPLALPNATTHLSTIFATRPTSTTGGTNNTGSQTIDKTVTAVPSGILSSRTTNDARQTSGSIDQTSVGQSSNDKMQVSRPQQPVNATFRTGLTKPEQGAVDLTHFVKDERGSGEAKMTPAQTSNPFRFDILAVQSPESSVSSQPSDAHQALHTVAGSGQLLTAIKIDDRKMGAKPFATDSNYSSDLHSVVVDKPLIKTSQSHSREEQDLLSEVKVDSVKADKAKDTSGGESAGQLSPDFDVPSRKISLISQKSSGSVGALSDGERSVDRKISAISQQSIELGSVSSSRKSSSSKSDKPRISIESYKPQTELKIEKPATNPFEQYRATVKYKLNKPREKSFDSQKPSTEMKGDLVEGHQGHSTHIASSASVGSEGSTQASVKHEEPKV